MHNFNPLIDSLIYEKYTLVDQRERFDMILRHYDNINALSGDIVECGVWRGGMSIFLTKLFHEKTIWLADSFAGFQDHTTAKYSYEEETHFQGGLSVSLDEVQQHFTKFDLTDDPRLRFLPGYVINTLNPDTCPIQSIALLRVDVDAYSATLEVLDYLYPKVLPGGYIIFDDSCLQSAREAVNTYRKRENISLPIYDVKTDELLSEGMSSYPCGCYTIKPRENS